MSTPARDDQARDDPARSDEATPERAELRRGQRDLGPTGPLGTIDRSLALVRAGGLDAALPALSGGAILALTVLFVYYAERVEGISSLRLLFAFVLVLAWWMRSYFASRSARAYAGAMWGVTPERPSVLDVVRTSSVVLLGLWVWSWLIAAASLGGVFVVLLVLPLFAFRGAIAPSWLARSGCEQGAGWRAFYGAVRDNDTRRIEGMIIEGLLIAGGLGIALNLYVAALAGVVLLRTFAGLELASVESFLSASNTFVTLSIAAITVVLLEPLRAAYSAQVFVGARVRAEGLDLLVALEDAIRYSRGRPRADRAARAAVLLLSLGLASVAARASAQDLSPPPERVEPPPPAVIEAPSALAPDVEVGPGQAMMGPDYEEEDIDPRDLDVEHRVDAILGRPEFREFEDRRGDGLADLIERLLDWLLRPREAPAGLRPVSLPSIPLPPAWVFVVIGVLILGAVGAYLLATRAKDERKDADGPADPVRGLDPRERPPASFLDEATALAAKGDLRAALRSLYLATLVSLDRRRLIAFDPHRTNWHYLRQMARSETREQFAQLTRLFDHKWYGEEPTTDDDYRTCRDLAIRIVGERSAS
ncbi:MAG: DUF4129 domain-containing protein [Sandaracinaceae bacterium]